METNNFIPYFKASDFSHKVIITNYVSAASRRERHYKLRIILTLVAMISDKLITILLCKFLVVATKKDEDIRDVLHDSQNDSR